MPDTTINVSEVLNEMLAEARKILERDWSSYKEYFKSELKALAGNLKLIDKLKTEGKITEEQAKLYLGVQKYSMQVVLHTMTGLALITIERIINAVIMVACTVVSRVLGWSLC